MAGHALAIASFFPDAAIIGVEPEGADDFRRSMAAGRRVRLDRPSSICDGLLSYDVGEHNWPILRRLVKATAAISDLATRQAMKWLDDAHGLRTEPSGAITTAAILARRADLAGVGDLVVVLSGRNVDGRRFQGWIADVPET